MSNVCSRLRAVAAFVLICSCPLSWLASPGTAGGEDSYSNALEAYRAGIGLLQGRKYAESVAALQQAFALAKDDQTKLKVADALMSAARNAGEGDKVVSAAEFVIEKTDQPAKKSLTRTALLNNVYQRGKVEEFRKRHEDVLSKDPLNRTSLYVLSETYVRYQEQPERAIELIERLQALDEKAGAKTDLNLMTELARQYVAAKRFQQGAEMHEKVAAADPKLAAASLKDAAQAWLKAGDQARAFADAQASAAAVPESRGDLLAYFWRRGLGDVFLATGHPDLAVPQFEEAIKLTTIPGSIADCQKSLAEARQKAGL